MHFLSLPDPFQYAYQAPTFEVDLRYEHQLFDLDEFVHSPQLFNETSTEPERDRSSPTDSLISQEPAVASAFTPGLPPQSARVAVQVKRLGTKVIVTLAEKKKLLCPLCEQKYTRKGDAKGHFIKKHKDHPRFAEIMRRNFPSKSSKVGKPFCCPLDACKSGYVRKSDLNKHLRDFHGQGS